jgi:hypothetical protein
MPQTITRDIPQPRAGLGDIVEGWLLLWLETVAQRQIDIGCIILFERGARAIPVPCGDIRLAILIGAIHNQDEMTL